MHLEMLGTYFESKAEAVDDDAIALLLRFSWTPTSSALDFFFIGFETNPKHK